jgi:hypothetical protein
MYCTILGRDSSVGIATGYRLDGPGILSRWGQVSSHPSRPTLGPTQPPVQWELGLSRGKSGRGVMLTTYPLLASRSRKGRSIPLSTLWACSGLKRECFTFTILKSDFSRNRCKCRCKQVAYHDMSATACPTHAPGLLK